MLGGKTDDHAAHCADHRRNPDIRSDIHPAEQKIRKGNEHHCGGDRADAQGYLGRLVGRSAHKQDPRDRTDQSEGAEQQRQAHHAGAWTDALDEAVGALLHHHGGQRDRRDHGTAIGLKDVGSHARHVANVVADVIGDDARIARIVLGNAGLDLADQVRADVGALGEDSAADTIKQRDHAGAHAETVDAMRRLGIGAEHEIQRAETEQAQRGQHEAHHRAAVKGDRERFARTEFVCRGRRAHIGARRGVHAEEAREGRAERAGQERNGRLVAQRRKDDRDGDHGDRGRDQLQLPAHERHGAELDLAGDLLRLAGHHGISHHRAENDKCRKQPYDAHDERDQVNAHGSPSMLSVS